MKAREARERKGKLITSIDELMQQDQVIFNDQLIDIKWCHGWTLKQTKKNIERKLIYTLEG